MTDRKMFYVELGHGALLVLAHDEAEAREVARRAGCSDADDLAIDEMPDAVRVDDDAGFEWHPVSAGYFA